MRRQHIFILEKIKKIFLLCLLTCSKSNTHLLKLPPSRTYFHGPKGVQAIDLVGCFGPNGTLRQYFSLYRAVSQRGGERNEK